MACALVISNFNGFSLNWTLVHLIFQILHEFQAARDTRIEVSSIEFSAEEPEWVWQVKVRVFNDVYLLIDAQRVRHKEEVKVEEWKTTQYYTLLWGFLVAYPVEWPNPYWEAYVSSPHLSSTEAQTSPILPETNQLIWIRTKNYPYSLIQHSPAHSQRYKGNLDLRQDNDTSSLQPVA